MWNALPLSASIRTISGAVASSACPGGRPRAVDFRAVQGAITVDGVGNLLSGLAGTTPNTATTVGASVTELTGVGAFASRSGWDAAMAERLDAACEETLLTLVRQEKEEERRLRLVAYREGGGAVLEFVVASRDENVQDRRALLGDEPGEALG